MNNPNSPEVLDLEMPIYAVYVHPIPNRAFEDLYPPRALTRGYRPCLLPAKRRVCNRLREGKAYFHYSANAAIMTAAKAAPTEPLCRLRPALALLFGDPDG